MEPQLGKALGVMQPYFFPYLGYFQYVHACDEFILYDDVQFIMRGWINRNNILMGGKAFLFTVPLKKASPNRTIAETMVAWDGGWEEKLLRTLDMAYAKAPKRKEVLDLFASVLRPRSPSMAELAALSISAVADHLEIGVPVRPSSAVYQNAHLDRVHRLVDLCRRTNSDTCIVPIGGKELYAREEFMKHGIGLKYISPGLNPYQQGARSDFVPSLSIIDVLMWNEREEVRTMLKDHKLG
jgi:hypothetical protein